jgi:hypothetical protein
MLQSPALLPVARGLLMKHRSAKNVNELQKQKSQKAKFFEQIEEEDG